MELEGDLSLAWDQRAKHQSSNPPAYSKQMASPDDRHHLQYSRSQAIREFEGFRVGTVGVQDFILEFKDWAEMHWESIVTYFKTDDMFQHIDGGMLHRRGKSKAEWVHLCKDLGFTGRADLIFDEITKELHNETEDKRLDIYKNKLEDMPVSDSNKQSASMSLCQLRRFEGRLKKIDSCLKAKSSGSPADHFVQLLLKKRGTLLRAWRMDIDIRLTGRVTYVDFAQRCRDLGTSMQPRKIWNSLCPDGQHLEFQALAPDEARNLGKFADVLRRGVGVDLDKAWAFMDSSHQNWVSAKEFEQCTQELGFEGDVNLIFCGLDATGAAQPPSNKKGLGRLCRNEFNYFVKISQFSQSPTSCNVTSGPIDDLIMWANREHGTPEELILKLGLAGRGREISAGDLAARLTAMGFDGDAREAARMAALHDSMVSAESLARLLSGVPPMLEKNSRIGHSPISERGCRSRSQPRQGRCIGDRPDSKAKNRSRFQPKQGSPIGAHLDVKPTWNPSFGMASESSNLNCQLTKYSRHYFSDPSDKPVKQEMMSRRVLPRNQR